MRYKSFELDQFQIDAVTAISKNESVVVSAATGTGKTLIADYAIDMYLKKGQKIVYTAPIKALSNQKYRQFKEEFGEERVGLITGDIVINPKGDVLIMTVEIYRNMLMVSDPMIPEIACVVFDEIHFINDRDRGVIWEESIIFSPNTVRFVCLSATIPNVVEFASWIQKIKKHKVEVVEYHNRPVPLTHMFYEKHTGLLSFPEFRKKEKEFYSTVKKGVSKKDYYNDKQAMGYLDLSQFLYSAKKTPALFFVFSRAKTEAFALELSRRRHLKLKVDSEKINSIIDEILGTDDGEIFNLNTSKILIECLKKGIGFHHAGLLPRLKFLVEKLFGEGLLHFLFATETFAVGINMPAKTVVFESLRKYDGVSFRYLKTKEYYQMAGRAGRRGLDKEGTVVSIVEFEHIMKNYVDDLMKGDIEPIKSQFQLSYNTVINLARQYSYKESVYLLKNSFFEYQSKSDSNRIPQLLNRRLTTLKKNGYLDEYSNLTEKGFFLSKVYTESLLIAEIFCRKDIFEFDQFEWLFLVGLVVYEPGKNDYFNVKNSGKGKAIIDKFGKGNLLYHYFTSKDAFIVYDFLGLWYENISFLELMKLTNLLEGDIIRWFRMIIDVLFQIKNATENPEVAERCMYLVYRIEREYIVFEE
ncbi:DEAD/DEAH box helicase [bacterium]|nr:DEAD/DEAH box helicase [bacterium]